MATLLVLVAGALAWWVGRSGPEMRMELRFLDYTNETVGQFFSYTNQAGGIPGLPEGAVVQGWQPSLLFARVLATNSGEVPLELYASVNATNFVTTGGGMQLRDGFASPSGQNMPRILKPGETTIILIGPSQFLRPWSTEIMAQRRGLRDKLYGKVWDTGKPTFQKWVSRLPSAFVDIRPTLGPITNLPPNSTPSAPPRGASP